MFSKDFATYVGPKFLHFVGQAVPHDERGEGGDVAAESAILSGVIDIREPRSHSIADRLRVIETIMAGIGARDEEPIDAVPGAFFESAFSHLVVARVFLEQGWKNRNGHISTDGIVCEGRTEAFAISAPTLTPGLGIVLGLSNTGKRRVKGIGEPIKHTGRREAILLAGR
ncbi:MAG TPA: hypothetical protein VGF20_15720 [Candidatus Acidoferrum sp.]